MVPSYFSILVGIPTLLASIVSIVVHYFEGRHLDLTISEIYGPLATRVAFAVLSAIVAGFVGNVLPKIHI
jgi:hypothetical protein